MLPKNTRHICYVVFFVLLAAVCKTTIANAKVFALLAEMSSLVENKSEALKKEKQIIATYKTYSDTNKANDNVLVSNMFNTLIQGADEEVNCSIDGTTIARFNLCGDFDDRIISLAGGPYANVVWENVTGGCTPDLNSPCPSSSCTYTVVGTAQTFAIDANSISPSGDEFRVRVDNGDYYYFEVTKSTITQSFVKKDVECGVNGRIQITGLSSAYEFSIDGGSGFGSWQGPIFDNLIAGSYNVKARLKNTYGACEYPYLPIEIEEKNITIEATFVDVQCASDLGSITVNVNNSVSGPYKYTLLDNHGNAQEFTAYLAEDSYTFPAVGLGTYMVQVQTQQCKGDQLNGIDPPRQDRDTNGNPIIIGGGITALEASTEVNNSFGCATINSVDIKINTTGGTAPYTYVVNGSGASSAPYTANSTYTVTSPGSYDFLITDSNGCTTTASSDVEELSPPTINPIGIDGTCSNGGARINFDIVNANGYNLSYRINPSDSWTSNSSISVDATPSGTTYSTIEVRYQQGAFECTMDLADVTVSSVSAVSSSATKIADTKCTGSGSHEGGQIDFTPATGGTGSGYTYSVDGINFSSTPSFKNLVAGSYTPMIEDDGGCRLELSPITIVGVDPPTDIDFISSNSSCVNTTIDLQLVPTSNTAIVNYSIISPTTINNGTSDTFAALDASKSYIFQITDANNCTYTEGYSPEVVSSIRVKVKSGNDIRICSGGTTGSGSFLIDGFSNNYTYNINGGVESAPQNDSEITITNLSANTYTITVTDVDTACTDTASFTIQEPPTPLSLTGNVTPMSCANGNLGRVEAQPTGGWGNTRYTLIFPGGTTVGPNSGAFFGNLSVAGTYTLQATDAEGCTASFTFDLTRINAPTIALDNAASNFCYSFENDATLVVSSTAGTATVATHKYRINGGALQTSPTFTGLKPGDYTIEVVDGNNCSNELNVTIQPQLRVSTNIETEIPCGSDNGQIEVAVTGGYLASTTPKTYAVSTDSGTTFGAETPFTTNTFLYNTRVAGDYIFRITDNRGCIAESEPIKLNPPESINPASVRVTPASCGKTDNGIVTIVPDATSGVPGYEISFNGGPFSAQATFSNLTAGTSYNYVVRDSRGCTTLTASVTIPVDNTPPPDATVSANLATCTTGVLEGAIDVTAVSGGTANYTYILQNEFGVEIDSIGPTASTTGTFDNVPPGDYRIVTIDALGCRDIDYVTIEQNTIQVLPDPVTPVCDVTGFSNTVEIFGGGGPFLIRLVNIGSPAPVNSPPRRHTFSGLQYGVVYTVEVTDQSTGCVYLDEIPPVNGPSTLQVSANTTNGYCDANRYGQIVYQIDGFTNGSNLRVEVLNSDDGTRTTIASPVGVSPTYSGTYEALPGNYQIIVTDLTDNCSAATPVTITQNLPAIDVLSTDPANCTSDGSITVQGSGGNGGPYTFAFMAVGTTPTSADFTASTTFFGPEGTYDVYVKDASGCTSFAIAEIIPIDPSLPAPSFVVNNQCAVASPSFNISVRVPSSVNTPRFTLGGDAQFPVDNGSYWEYTYIVNTPGDYIVDVVDANGCTSSGTASVYEFLSASGGFTTTPSCNNADGQITITTNGGSGNFNYELTGTDALGAAIGPITQVDNQIFTNIRPGDYQVLVTDRDVDDGSSNCTYLVDDINLEAAVSPVILPTALENISCHDANDGSINITLEAGSDVDSPINYRLLNYTTRALISSNFSGSFTGLSEGRYEVEVVTARNCTDLSGELVITNPPLFSITADATPFMCDPGSNRLSSSTVTATITNTGTPSNYRYSITGYENYQTSNTFEITDNGTTQNITVYAIDDKGCRSEASVVINQPTAIISQIIASDALDCRNPERVRIQVQGTTNFTISTVSATPVAAVANTAGQDYVDVFLPASGDYIFEVKDNSPLGCAYPMPIYTVEEPAKPTVVIQEATPVKCSNGIEGEFNITVTDYVGEYHYKVYSGSDPAKTTVLVEGDFNTANNPEKITGFAGGNFFVEVTAKGAPYCSADSNIGTIRTPNGELKVKAMEVGNVSCANDSGSIEANGFGGWDTSPYTYRLLKDNGAGYVEVAGYSSSNEFNNLSSGDYRVEIRDIAGCIATDDITLSMLVAINAGIREPMGLQCPNGNNAVLEVYDPTTGDADTATAGASGGYARSGYTYRLLYLNSNDNTDIVSTSGLQNSPTFIGASGGFISEGWYAIEVTSGFQCSFVTAPYFVSPPEPIQPKLIMTRVPGCGGLGEMRLFVENFDPAFTYEYVGFEDDVQVGSYKDLPASASILIEGVEQILYQFDVRKKNSANVCEAVRSNGIRMSDADDITLITNSPIDPISCASEIDGRIESFTSGGVGDEMFTLYIGQPIDGFNKGSATIFREPQSEGTFEGLPEGSDYWIGVTSGVSCEAIDGPFEVLRPDPIIYNSSSTPVSCNGGTDGSVTVEIISGGEGLIQFAIAPDFDKFFSDSAMPGVYTFDNLSAGDHEVLIQDENGCPERVTITVAQPQELNADATTTPETCIGFEDGTITLVITGGTPYIDPITSKAYYETKFIGPNSDGSEVFVRNDDLHFENLVGGESYVILIQDANSCFTDVIVPIEIGVDLTASAQVSYGCEGIFPNNEARVNIENTDLLPALLFALDPIDPTNAITSNAGAEFVWGDLTPGDHIVYIYHENGCTNTVEFSIDAYEPLLLSAEKTGPNEVTATATGGYGSYEFFFQGVSTGSERVFHTNVSTVVTIQVEDQGGCVAVVTIPFEFTGKLEIPNYFTPDGDNQNDLWAPKYREYYPNIVVKIFDRYGRIVKVLDQIEKWDGNYGINGLPLPSGDYWYEVNANDKSKLRYIGHFTLIR